MDVSYRPEQTAFYAILVVFFRLLGIVLYKNYASKVCAVHLPWGFWHLVSGEIFRTNWLQNFMLCIKGIKEVATK